MHFFSFALAGEALLGCKLAELEHGIQPYDEQ